jgi:polyhydroxyalkanoate synthesis regulator phasin
MFNSISEDLKKIILAGIGAVAVTTEKSKSILEELVKKGEITVEQGKVLNEELKRNIRHNAKDEPQEAFSDVVNQLEKMSKEDIAVVKAKLAELERIDSDGEADKKL